MSEERLAMSDGRWVGWQRRYLCYVWYLALWPPFAALRAGSRHLGHLATSPSGHLATSPTRHLAASMLLLAVVTTAAVALLHAGFLALEMFLWDTPSGRRVFGTSREFAAASKSLAANQGLYNGFLAAGLAWGLWLGDDGVAVRTFFLACVVIAGVFGAATVNQRIFWIQALPAIVALALTVLAGR